jgi:hypothetical protein
MKESVRSINKESILLEKKLLGEFSSNFWTLCLNSNVFTLEEKQLIKSDYINESINLIKEEWKFLNKAADYFSDKSKEIRDKFVSKVKAIKDSISSFVKSIKDFAKKFFFMLLDGAKKEARKVYERQKGKFTQKMKTLDQKEMSKEKKNLIETFSWWGYVASGVDDIIPIPKISNGFSLISNKIDSFEANVESEVSKNIVEAEKELEGSANESIGSIINSTNEDILSSFYRIHLIKEQEEKKEEGKKEGVIQNCISWLLGFLEVEKLDPEVKTGKKLLWWGKLFLKILQACLNPIIIVIEKVVVKNALTAVSWVTTQFKGPGKYDFVVLGGLAAALFGVVADFGLIFPIDHPLVKLLGFAKSWLAHSLEFAGGFFPGYDAIKIFLKVFCLSMAMFHLSHAIHEYEESKEEEIADTKKEPELVKKPVV